MLRRPTGSAFLSTTSTSACCSSSRGRRLSVGGFIAARRIWFSRLSGTAPPSWAIKHCCCRRAPTERRWIRCAMTSPCAGRPPGRRPVRACSTVGHCVAGTRIRHGRNDIRSLGAVPARSAVGEFLPRRAPAIRRADGGSAAGRFPVELRRRQPRTAPERLSRTGCFGSLTARGG